jgi:23S rRNA (guanosine2251-2'-O)-methyltransferase
VNVTLFRKLHSSELERKSIDEFHRSEKIPVTIILDNVRSMNNVGSVFRTADAFLLEGIVLCGYTPRPPHRDIQKTALGATETVHWEYEENIVAAIQRLKDLGFRVCAVEQTEGSTSLMDWAIQPEEKWALILGNEVEGVQDAALALCDAVIEIPQSGMKHSLNISVAAGIVFWEVYKRYR